MDCSLNAGQYRYLGRARRKRLSPYTCIERAMASRNKNTASSRNTLRAANPRVTAPALKARSTALVTMADAGRGNGLGRQAAIQRAKQEWEGTADALAALVCVLDHAGQIVRSNRVVEDWSLGTVVGVLGKQVHAVLHAGCRRSGCDVAAFLRHAIAEIARGKRTQFELQQPMGTRHLQLTVRPMRVRYEGKIAGTDPLAVLVATDFTALHQASEALERLNGQLEMRVRARTQALADANADLRNEIIRREGAEEALRTSRNELAALSAQLIRAQEEERKRIAVELHDSVGQSLSAVKYTLERGIQMLRQPRLGNVDSVLQLAVRRLQETAESIRAISLNLRPKILDDLGAASAVQWFCRDFAEIYPSIIVHTALTARDQDVPDRLATVVYRCLQELLNNVAKHANARNVWVLLEREGQVLTLEVRDNGVGLEHATAESRRHGTGLRNLRERAEMTGGKFRCMPAPGSGTFTQLTWPLEERERAELRAPVA
jgi:signal transduction histidine kinase